MKIHRVAIALYMTVQCWTDPVYTVHYIIVIIGFWRFFNCLVSFGSVLCTAAQFFCSNIRCHHSVICFVVVIINVHLRNQLRCWSSGLMAMRPSKRWTSVSWFPSKYMLFNAIPPCRSQTVEGTAVKEKEWREVLSMRLAVHMRTI